MGGISSEREISLKTSKSMLEHLDREKYEPIPIEINKKEDVFLKCQDIDFALIGLHGEFGEDGCVQSILGAMNIPYSGCGPRPSALAMDKDTSKKIFKLAGIRTADWVVVRSVDNLDLKKINALGYPVFVKPNSGGSSVATAFVKRPEELIPAIEEALIYDDEVMIETYIKGDEITTPVINGELCPTIVIKPKGEFFDIKSKYVAGETEYNIVTLDSPLREEVEAMVQLTWKELKLESYARVDMIVQEGVPYLLEVNTLPGMTPTSLLPQSYAALGHTFTDLLTTIIESSLQIQRRMNS